jgi:hypothetical protein
MVLHQVVRDEWNHDHCLTKRSMIWIRDHADPDDPNPYITAIAQLRAEGATALHPGCHTRMGV